MELHRMPRQHLWKGIYLTLGELYKCNNVAQLLFNFEGFLLDNIVHNGRFKPNYPFLFPKFTIKLSINPGSGSSSSLSIEDTELHQDLSVWSQKKVKQTDR